MKKAPSKKVTPKKVNPLTVMAALSTDNVQTTFHAVAKSYGEIDKVSDSLYSELKAAGFVGNLVFDTYNPSDTVCRFVFHDCWLEGYLVGRGFTAKERRRIQAALLAFDTAPKGKRPELSEDDDKTRESAKRALRIFMAIYRGYLATGKAPEAKPKGANNRAAGMTELQGAMAAFAVVQDKLRKIVDGKEGGNKQLATELLEQSKVFHDQMKAGISATDSKFLNALFVSKMPRVSVSPIKKKKDEPKPLTATAKAAR